nr:MAG TPA: peptidase [Caudoviricetes sp.]
MDRRFNLQKAKEDKRDWRFAKVVNVAAMPKKSLELADYIVYTLDQKNVGFCHSFAAATIKNAQEYMETGIPYELSPLYIAKQAKAIDSFPDTEGTDLLTICKVLNKYGTVEERFYPFEKYKAGSLEFPKLENEESLTHFKWGNYARLEDLGDLKNALNIGKYALIGIQVTDDIYKLEGYKGEDIPVLNFDPKGKMVIIGGHAVVGVKDCPDKGAILCKNSYGADWGKNGYFYIPYEYFTFETKDIGFSLVMDMFAPVDIRNDKIRGTVMEFYIDSDTAYVNGKEIKLTQAPKIDPQTNRTLIGLRDICEILGCGVYWDDKQKKITILKEEELK